MGGRLTAAITALALVIAALGADVGSAAGSMMCAPTTIADLVPQKPATTSPPPPESATTTAPNETPTTLAEEPTSTTLPNETPTTLAEEPTTTTQPEGETTTTEAGPTPTTEPEATPTTETTATTAPAPSPTTTTPPTTEPPALTTDEPCIPFVYEMLWPVLSGGRGISPFGAPRDGGSRHHLGYDIIAPKMSPVVAVADGEIIHSRDDVGTEDCCLLGLRHDDGWSSWYIHLNNDVFGTDDGQGWGIRPGIEVGSRIIAGEVIGWVGDSGNAEGTVPHLHFELRQPDGTPIDPAASLDAARLQQQPALPDGNPEFAGAYFDGGITSEMLSLLASLGWHSACDDYGARFCPDDPATPGDASAWLGEAVGEQIPEVLGTRIESPLAPIAGPQDCLIDGCPATGITKGDLIRLVMWRQIHAEDAANGVQDNEVAGSIADTSGIPLASDHPNLLDLQSAIELARWGGVLSICDWSPDVSTTLGRGSAMEFLAMLNGLIPSYPCQGEPTVAGSPDTGPIQDSS